MKFQILITAALFAASPAWAVNKCKGPDGKVRYQDTPCPVAEVSETVKVQANGSGSAKQLPHKVMDISSAQAQDTATAAVTVAKRSLKDPESAKFSDLKVLSFTALGKSYTMTCGQLNAKNSYGGYVGFKSFWVYQELFTEAFNHYLPGSNMAWLMGDIQSACIASGIAVSAS